MKVLEKENAVAACFLFIEQVDVIRLPLIALQPVLSHLACMWY
jgi:hypothetical protein